MGSNRVFCLCFVHPQSQQEKEHRELPTTTNLQWKMSSSIPRSGQRVVSQKRSLNHSFMGLRLWTKDWALTLTQGMLHIYAWRSYYVQTHEFLGFQLPRQLIHCCSRCCCCCRIRVENLKALLSLGCKPSLLFSQRAIFSAVESLSAPLSFMLKCLCQLIKALPYEWRVLRRSFMHAAHQFFGACTTNVKWKVIIPPGTRSGASTSTNGHHHHLPHREAWQLFGTFIVAWMAWTTLMTQHAKAWAVGTSDYK